MKKLFYILGLILPFTSYSQSYLPAYSYGYSWYRGKFDSSLIIPRGPVPLVLTNLNTTPGQIWYNTSLGTLQVYNGSSWVTLSSGGSGTVTNVGSGYGILGGPITSSGTLTFDSATINSLYRSWLTWSNVSGKPTTFPPSAHTHPISQVVGLDDSLSSVVHTRDSNKLYITPFSNDSAKSNIRNEALTNFIQNQNSSNQSGNFRILGNGRLNSLSFSNGTNVSGTMTYMNSGVTLNSTNFFDIRSGSAPTDFYVDSLNTMLGGYLRLGTWATGPTVGGTPTFNVMGYNTSSSRYEGRIGGVYRSFLTSGDMPSSLGQIPYVSSSGTSFDGNSNFVWSNSKLGVGTNSPDSTLTVGGGVRITSGLKLDNVPSGSATDSILTVDAFGTIRKRVQVSGGGSGSYSFVAPLIDDSGIVSIDLSSYPNNAALNDTASAIRAELALKGSGTVTSISNGYGILGGTITTTGSLRVDTSTLGPMIRSWNYWDAISGKPSTFTPSAHVHPIAQVTGLSDSLLAIRTFAGTKLSTSDSITRYTTIYRDDTAKNNIRVQISGKQDALGFTAENVSNKSTSTALGSSDTLYPTQNAVKVYADTKVSLIDSGVRYVTPYQNRLKLNISDTSSMLSVYARNSALKDSMLISRGLINAKQDALGFTAENVANKSTTTSLGTSNTLYPTQNAVKVYADTKVALTDSGVRYVTPYQNRLKLNISDTSAMLSKYVRKSSLVYNIQDFGATPNDTTDDWMAIMATIASAGITGGIVYIPPGRYELSSSVAVTAPNIHIKGSGMGSSILKLKSTASPIPGFDIIPVVVMSDTFQRPLLNVSIDNVSITTAVSYPDRTGIYGTDGILMISCRNFTVDKIEVNNTIVGIHIDGCEDGSIIRCNVHNCSADGIAGFAFMNPNRRINVDFNTVYQVGDDGISCNTYVDLGSASNEDYVISHNTLKAIGGGGISVWGAKRVLVTENTVDSSFSNSIKVASGYGFSDVENVIVSKNIFMNGAQRTTSGVGVVAEAAGITVLQYDTLYHVKGVDITGNRIITPRGNYIAVSNAVGTKFANDINVIDNKCIGGNTAAPVSDPYKRKWSDDGIYINIRGDINVSENKIYKARENGINVTSLANRYVSVSRNIVDSANIARTAGRAAITVNSSSRANIYNNTVRLIGSPDSSFICARTPYGAWSNNLGGFNGRNIAPIYFKNSEALDDSLIVGMDYLSPFGERKVVVPLEVSSKPTIVFNSAGNGSGGIVTSSIVGDNKTGTITWTTGTSPGANSLIATVSFVGFGYPNNFKVRFYPNNKNASEYFGNGTHLLKTENYGNFTINSNDFALQSSTEYSIIYDITPL